MCDSRQAAFLDLPIMVSAPYAHAKKIARFFTRRSLPSLLETHRNFLDKCTTILSEIFFVFVSIAHYTFRNRNQRYFQTYSCRRLKQTFMESVTKFVPLTLCDDSEDTLQRLPCPQHRGPLCTDVRLRPTDRLTIRLRAR